MSAIASVHQILSQLAQSAGIERTVAARETLFRAGAEVRELFIVVTGEIRLLRHTEVGQVLILQRATAGLLVAEASLFSPRYHCDGVAAVDSIVIAFKAKDVRTALATNADALLTLSQHLAAAVVDLRSKNALLGVRSASARLLAYLSLLANDEGFVELQGPWTAVALEVGLSHEAVYRALAELENTGQVQREGRRVRLLHAASR